MPICDSNLVPTFPDCPMPNYVGSIGAGSYSVRESQSDRGYRSSVLLSCSANKAAIELVWSKASQSQVCQLMNFYHLCKGTHQKFRIDREHPIYGCIGAIADCFVAFEGEYWHWIAPPEAKPVLNYRNEFWAISIRLESVR